MNANTEWNDMFYQNMPVSERVEIVKITGEILFPWNKEQPEICSYQIDTRPVEYLSTKTILTEIDKILQARNDLRLELSYQRNSFECWFKYDTINHKNQKTLDKLMSRLQELQSLEQEDFDPKCVWSFRRYASATRRMKVPRIMEVRIEERSDTPGYVVSFREHVHNPKTGARYSTEKAVLFVREIVEDEKRMVRILWKYKGKLYFGRVPSAIYTELGVEWYMVQGYLEKKFEPRQVLPILAYIKPTNKAFLASAQLHGVTESQAYWIGAETSVKKIMAKAYGRSGVDGLTKHAFGGFNSLNNIDDLMIAINVVRGFKAFKPQVFEKIRISEEYDFATYVSVQDVEYYVKHFETRALQEQITSPDFRKWVFTEIALTAKNFRKIRSTKLRNAMREHVRRCNFNVEQTTEFVTAELNKLGQGEIKLKTKYDKYNGHKITPKIKVVMPKKGADLVEWGATQNNCIGGYSFRVADKQAVIFGFKDPDGNWIGHAEVDDRDNLRQLLGKHNSNVYKDYYSHIIKWFKSININVDKNFWGYQ